tara:strand:- start:181 stop:690 length:510 start_codon:yes stop_codon:yes gene_type:complete
MLLCTIASGPVLANEPLSDKMDKLSDDLPKFSDNPEGIGVGVGVGEPMGLALAYRPNEHHTLASLVGWSLSDKSLHLHVDYQVRVKSFPVPESPVSVDLYTGVGPTLNLGRDDDTTGLGARVPLGISVAFEKPVDIFVEIAPVIGVLPEIALHGSGTIGFRGWFRPKQR